MDDCLFCKIGKKEIPSKLVYEDADIFAFEDLHPQAPNHILICPRKHLVSLTDSTAENTAMLGTLQLVAANLAADRKLTDGYRTNSNNGRDAGQTTFPLHRHLPYCSD